MHHLGVPEDDIEVREADENDVPAVARLLGQLGYAPSEEILRSDITSGEAGDVLVASDGRRVVGLLTLKLHRQLHWGAAVASIEALVVDEGARSEGVGAKLVASAVERARSVGAILVEVHSNHARSDARRFYEREGFVVTSNYFVRRL